LSNKPNPGAGSGRPAIYQIRVKGHLDRRRSDWFGGMTITPEEGGETLLTCPVANQAALHSLLKKVRDVGIPLISVSLVDASRLDASDA
jgi:hypothetical protein